VFIKSIETCDLLSRRHLISLVIMGQRFLETWGCDSIFKSNVYTMPSAVSGVAMNEVIL
jgi:hypothetical protein